MLDTATVSTTRRAVDQRAASSTSRRWSASSKFAACHRPMQTASASRTFSMRASAARCRASSALIHSGSAAPTL